MTSASATPLRKRFLSAKHVYHIRHRVLICKLQVLKLDKPALLLLTYIRNHSAIILIDDVFIVYSLSSVSIVEILEPTHKQLK